MRCETAERALSADMDGEPADERIARHASSCPRCKRFVEEAWRLREATRFQVAPDIPDLVPAIMDRLGSISPDQMHSLRARRAPRAEGRRHRSRFAPLPAVAAALAAGLVIGFVLSSGGILPRTSEDRSALAEEIPGLLVAAAERLDGYRATFDVVERNWASAVPVRSFVAEVAFRSPESFRVQVRDTTSYPSPAWPSNDLALVTDGRTYWASGRDPCPRESLPACPSSQPLVQFVRSRPPFDNRWPMPSDIVVPMTVLAAADRVHVLGPDRVGDRDAVVVQLDYRDATPLFSYLRFLGSWRPFYPHDRVLVWLDARTWFPLRYQVFPAPDEERASWAAQSGLPREDPSGPVFSAVATYLTTNPPGPDLFTPGRVDRGRSERFEDRPLTEATEAGGRPFPQPAQTAGLRPWRFGRFAPAPGTPYRQSVLAYADGLAWLTITRVEDWSEAAPFGVGPFAEPVRLPIGPAYYEPATSDEPRRVALHTHEGEFLVASNLPRATLLDVAGSLPLSARLFPASWLTRSWSGGSVREGLTVDQAVQSAGFAVLLPTWLPDGYAPAAGRTFLGKELSAVTVVFRRPGAELNGVGLRLHQAERQALPPPTGGDERGVIVRGHWGRWSPESQSLEWIEEGVYRSLSGAEFKLASLIRLAESLRPSTLEESS